MQKIIMAIMAIMLLAFISPASANESFSSEVSHFIGGAAMAGGVTAVADHYQYEHRGMIGFAVSTAGIVLAEAIQVATGGGTASGSLVDVASHTLGSALGAMISDGLILTPVIAQTSAGNNYYGLTAMCRF